MSDLVCVWIVYDWESIQTRYTAVHQGDSPLLLQIRKCAVSRPEGYSRKVFPVLAELGMSNNGLSTCQSKNLAVNDALTEKLHELGCGSCS